MVTKAVSVYSVEVRKSEKPQERLIVLVVVKSNDRGTRIEDAKIFIPHVSIIPDRWKCSVYLQDRKGIAGSLFELVIVDLRLFDLRWTYSSTTNIALTLSEVHPAHSAALEECGKVCC